MKQEALFEDFISALEAEIDSRKDEIERVFASGGVNTLYVGGGTPSVMPLYFFERLTASLKRTAFNEFTVEVNPEDITDKGPEYIRGLMSLGVNRISMGVQSFDDGILKWMNRRHTSAQALEAYRILEDAGMENISIDLIFGLPQLTEPLWRETLDKALSISSRGTLPAHVSAYQLSVEEDSMLEKMISRGMCSEASEDACRMQYDVLCEVLGKAGYNHYEISNFARPGFEAQHNSAYWRHVPYVGLGPGAHSYIADAEGQVSGDVSSGRRQWNESDLKKYVEAGKTGEFSGIRGGERLDPEQIRMERIMLGLRTASGVPQTYLRRQCDGRVLDEALCRGNLVTLKDGLVRIPEERFFISDSIISFII
jgi:oxygen-independent coproporphyrinogen-3 oxidase